MAKILIADDADFMRMVLKKMLETNGHEVVGEADNGRDAVALYNMLHPDLVTLDITMPVMDGMTAAERIMGEHKDAKILMISAMGTQSFLKKAENLNIKGFLTKPFLEPQVIKAVEEALL